MSRFRIHWSLIRRRSSFGKRDRDDDNNDYVNKTWCFRFLDTHIFRSLQLSWCAANSSDVVANPHIFHVTHLHLFALRLSDREFRAHNTQEKKNNSVYFVNAFVESLLTGRFVWVSLYSMCKDNVKKQPPPTKTMRRRCYSHYHCHCHSATNKQLLCIIKSNLCSCFDRLAYFFSIRLFTLYGRWKIYLENKGTARERERKRMKGNGKLTRKQNVKYAHHHHSSEQRSTEKAEKLKEY